MTFHSELCMESAQAGRDGSPVNPDQDVARQHEHRSAGVRRAKAGLGAKEHSYPIEPIALIHSSDGENEQS
jgi:hypothetical protein